MSDTQKFRRQTVRIRNLPLVLLALAPSLLLGACNVQEKQEMAAALDRAESAAKRAEDAQHAAEAAAARAQTDKLAAAREAATVEEDRGTQPQPEPAQPPENQLPGAKQI